jgi:hypothetical protein
VLVEMSTCTAQTAAGSAGIGLGSVIAVVFVTWFYVIYFAATRRPEEKPT